MTKFVLRLNQSISPAAERCMHDWPNIIRHSHILALRDRHIHAKHRILLHAFILHKNATTVSYQMLNAECHNVLWGDVNCIILLFRGLCMNCF